MKRKSRSPGGKGEHVSEAENLLTLEKLKIAERLALAEGQLGAIKTLLEDQMKRVSEIRDHDMRDHHDDKPGCQAGKLADKLQAQPTEVGGGVGKSLGVAALLATVLVAVVSPIHQKIDFTTRLIDASNVKYGELQQGHSENQAEIAVLKQKFIETDGKFSSLDERTKRMEETTTKEDLHIRELMEVKLESLATVEQARRELLAERISQHRIELDCQKATVKELSTGFYILKGRENGGCSAEQKKEQQGV